MSDENENHDGEYNVNESDNEDDFDALKVLQDVMESYDTSNNKDSYVSFREKNSHLCGGALINVHWIITVPTCIIKFPSLSAVTAVLGVSHSLNQKSHISMSSSFRFKRGHGEFNRSKVGLKFRLET